MNDLLNEQQHNACKLIREASEIHATEVRISIGNNDHTKVFFRQGSDVPSLRYEYSIENGLNLCAIIYQGLTSESDVMFNRQRAQNGAISRKENLPDGLTRITVKTYPGLDGYDMALSLQYEGEDAAQEDGDIATELAIQAIKQLDENMFIVFADLDVNRPETLHNYERFKNVLMMAYNRGLSDGYTISQTVSPNE